MTEQERQFEIAIKQGQVNALRQEVAEMNKEREFWQQVRIQASIAIVQGWASTQQGLTKICMKGAVELADALVDELKRSDDVYAECRRMDAVNTASVCENMTKLQKELQKKGEQQ